MKRPAESNRRAEPDAAGPGGVENLDKVRDILFGTQMRDNERRFTRMEERLSKESGDLREENRKRLESLETFIRKEMQTLIDRFKTEQTQRVEAFKSLSADLKELEKSNQQRSNELSEQIAETQREIRQEMLEQTKSLRDELAAARTDQSAELERSSAELRGQKLDRAALADLLNQMAARLGDDGE